MYPQVFLLLIASDPGGAIERWEDENFRSCFADILSGNWRQHDPYDLKGRINARSSLYDREGQATVFRTYQGWLAFRSSRTFLLANAYIILRPFFTPVADIKGDPLDRTNWKFGQCLGSRYETSALIHASKIYLPQIFQASTQ
ncbi:hypothetical protein EW026_g2172 [Hermanssonia centrifuga]|uniref:Uncharacterized protein n=1 Tax=Hermanssonia centrifuga TaxID=98765 RepID=A0A4V3XB48_9APHY|nr:hypothetical protein EW026_g2172 [Hermanssonia centrifuga]